MSDLYLLKPHEFYDRYIAPELGTYLKRYFRNVCMEYMMLLNQLGRMRFQFIRSEPGLERQETLILLPRAQTAEILWDYVTGISHS